VDNLTGMAVFAKVVEAKSFSEAARQLGLSKSAVSKQISRLEERLGARLLNRTTRRLHLTEVGSQFYECCARVVAEAEEAELLVTRHHEAPRGILRINAPMDFGKLYLVPAMPELLGRYPELRIDLVLDDKMVDMIDEGFDAAIRIADMPHSSLIARKLTACTHFVCASPAYFERHGTPQVPDDLKDHNCLIYSYQRGGPDWVFRGPDGVHHVPVNGNMRVNNGEAVRSSLLAGLGIGYLPAFMVSQNVKSGAMATALDDYIRPDTAVYAVYPHSRYLSAKVRAFVDFMVERLANNPFHL
jgi:DNA-binding transcriptional LysR family regulator